MNKDYYISERVVELTARVDRHIRQIIDETKLIRPKGVSDTDWVLMQQTIRQMVFQYYHCTD